MTASLRPAALAALTLAGTFAPRLAAAPAPRKTTPQRAAAPGRLVVLVVVDQLRYQDLLWLSPEFGPRGFAGLGRPAPLRYDTVVTETAADHSVLSTGAYAELNGIVGNRYYDEQGMHESVDDPLCPLWPEEGAATGSAPGAAASEGRSAALLRVPTVGDAFKLGTNGQGRVVTVALKDRSALFLGGPSADLALWWETPEGRMTSTTCYAPEPPAWVVQHRAAHPSSEWKDWVWTPLHADVLARYVPEGRSEGAVPREVGPVFPHQVGRGKVDRALFTALRNSPAGTTIALQAAQSAATALGLGERGSTDLLAVGLPSVDTVGHQFGTVSRERVDAILRVHEELSAFLDGLRARLGPRLSIVLTADHGLTPMASDERRLHAPGGTIDLDALVKKLNAALDQSLGVRKDGWVAGLDGSAVTLRKPHPGRAIAIAADLLRREPGLYRVVPAGEAARESSAVRHAIFPGRSGDLLLVTRPLWTLKKKADGADHGSPWNDDALVPLSVQAPGFKLHRDGRVLDASQVAPTLAALLDTAPPAAALADPAIARDE